LITLIPKQVLERLISTKKKAVENLRQTLQARQFACRTPRAIQPWFGYNVTSRLMEGLLSLAYASLAIEFLRDDVPGLDA